MTDDFEGHWLHGLPPDWTEKRADFLCNTHRVMVDPDDYGDDLVAHYSIPHVQQTGQPLIEPASEIDSTKLLIETPILLVSKLNPSKRTVCTAEPHSEYPTLASGEFVAVNSDKIDGRYAYYLWCSGKVADRLCSLVQSATRSHQRVSPADILKLPWKWPPRDTQRQIARFLDEKTALIDELVARKRELLDRLAEHRQSIITRAVIKGLRAHVSMKSSGIDCIGTIPAHWSLTPFKWRCQVKSGQVDPTEPQYATMTLVAPDHIESCTGRLCRTTSAAEQGAISGKYLCPDGVVLYSKIRPALRKAVIYDGECLCSADVYAIDPGRDVLRKYLFYFLLTDAFATYADRESLRVAMPKVNQEALGAFPIPVPDLEEQREIARFCDDLDADYGDAVDNVRESIAMLNEYRSAYITVAVTGQVAGLR